MQIEVNCKSFITHPETGEKWTVEIWGEYWETMQTYWEPSDCGAEVTHIKIHPNDEKLPASNFLYLTDSDFDQFYDDLVKEGQNKAWHD